MINETRIKELLSKLNTIIDTSSVHGDVSPTSEKSGDGFAAPDKFFLTSETNVEKLSEKEVYLTHALLHQFYATGGVNNLDKSSIEQLHKKIKERMKEHSNFDKLDTVI
jgi:hypothetical protein